jgi:hypothetical protein
MDGVAAKVTEEVRVFLEDYDLDTRSREECPGDHAGRPSADDAGIHIDAARGTGRVSLHGA